MLLKIFLYHHEARQMPETIKQKAFQLEPVLERYRACKFSHTFPMEKPFNYKPLKLPSEHNYVNDVCVVTRANTNAELFVSRHL